MKSNPYQWLADRNPPRTLIEGGYRSLSIDALLGDSGRWTGTLGAALFGNSAGFDFSHLVQAIVPAPAALSASPVGGLHDGGPNLPAPVLEAQFEAERPTQYLSYESTPDTGAAVAMPTRPLVPAAVDSIGPVAEISGGAPAMIKHILVTQLSVDEPTQRPTFDHIADLGFLQNLPAFAWVPQPGSDQGDTAIRTSGSEVVPVGSAPVAVVPEGPVARTDLIHELTPAAGSDAKVSLSLFEHGAGTAVIASDLFITDPVQLPDLGSVQFAAVLPDPIVDPSPLV